MDIRTVYYKIDAFRNGFVRCIELSLLFSSMCNRLQVLTCFTTSIELSCITIQIPPRKREVAQACSYFNPIGCPVV